MSFTQLQRNAMGYRLKSQTRRGTIYPGCDLRKMVSNATTPISEYWRSFHVGRMQPSTYCTLQSFLPRLIFHWLSSPRSLLLVQEPLQPLRSRICRLLKTSISSGRLFYRPEPRTVWQEILSCSFSLLRG